jgi:lactate dehydrogenase-like 2-hydroxyacid dehydrogenase
MRIVISEVMDDPAVASLAVRFEVIYDRTLADWRDALKTAPADANALLTPHIAGVTRESNARVTTLIAEKVAAALDAMTGAAPMPTPEPARSKDAR